MKKQLSADFQTRLWNAAKAIEQDSQVEVVVVMRANSANYTSVPLTWGIVTAWLAHTYTMYAPAFFANWIVYAAPVFAFILSFYLAHLPAVIRFSIKQAVLLKNVEIMARAIFQKGGIHHTKAKIGLLIYCSYLEKCVYLLPDRGIVIAIPSSEWQTLSVECQAIFTAKNPNEALLAELHKVRQLLKRYLPIQPNDINELPEILDINL